MPTFYLDFENGNDANNGTTFANRWKSFTSGATAARTAPGDIIRVMGSPAPTSLGQNGVWTSQVLQATRAISSSTNTTPISVTTSLAHPYTTGDTVGITSHSPNTNANGTWEITVTGADTFTLNGSVGNAVGSGGDVRLRNNTRVMLTTAVTQNIASTGFRTTAWTASANVTAALVSTRKEHVSSDSIVIAAGFATGLAAYWALPSTLDLSGYQQVSFWIQQTSGTVGATGAVDLRLCSDTAGLTAVNTISIPNLLTTGRWTPVTVDLATNLGSSIRSIALYVNTDNGAQTFLLNNIIACKASSAADSLTLTSLIGKNTTGETFWGIQSINGTRVMLDADTNSTPTTTTLRGYYGTSGTVTTWKRETIKLGPVLSSVSVVQNVQESGTLDTPITYSGGWDRTAMTTQNLETWLDGVNGNGQAFFISNSNNSFVNFSMVRFTHALSLNGNAFSNTFTLGSINNHTSGAIVTNVSYWYNNITVDFICACLGVPYAAAVIGGGAFSTLNVVYGVLSNGSTAFTIGSGAVVNISGSTLNTLVANNTSGAAFNAQSGHSTLRSLNFENNGTTAITQTQGATPFRYLINCLLNATVEVQQSGSYDIPQLASQNHDQVAGNHKIFMDGGLISSATDQRHTASGTSWKFQPTNTIVRSSLRPVALSLAKVACAANSLVTIKAWMRRDNAMLTMRLACKGGQIAGVASDVTASVTTTNAWEELTITFTPTEIGVVEITAEAWGGSTHSGWVDDLTISQA